MFAIFLRTLAIFIMMLAGYIFRRRGMIDDDFNRKLSQLLLHVFYPSLILSSISSNYNLDDLLRNWILPTAIFAYFAWGWIAGYGSSRLLFNKDTRTSRCFHFQCVSNNYSFLPIMLVMSLYGEKAIASVVFASLGAELFIWTMGIQALSGQRFTLQGLKNLVTMPMISLVSAIAIVLIKAFISHKGVNLSESTPKVMETIKMLHEVCRTIGLATVPVSAIICGSRMAAMKVAHLDFKILSILTALRLAVIPAVAILALKFIPIVIEIKQIIWIIMIQPVSMSSVSLAECYDGDAEFASATVLSTHLLGLASIPLWLSMLQ